MAAARAKTSGRNGVSNTGMGSTETIISRRAAPTRMPTTIPSATPEQGDLSGHGQRPDRQCPSRQPQCQPDADLAPL